VRPRRVARRDSTPTLSEHWRAQPLVPCASARSARRVCAPGRCSTATDRDERLGRCRRGLSAVEVPSERVDSEGVGQDVEPLAAMSDGVSTTEPKGVVEVAVDGLGVIASWI